MSITERLANLSIKEVLLIMTVLLAIRFGLRKQTAPTWKNIAEVAESLAVAMGLVFLLIRPFVVQAFFIPSASMHPTLLEQDHLIVNKFIYRFREPARGDIVVFRCPPDASEDGQVKDYIKRVIALPGDLVRVTPGHLLINANEFGHTMLQSVLVGFAGNKNECSVKLLGDNVLVNGKVVPLPDVAEALDYPRNAKVKVVQGKVIRNGKVLKEPYIAEDPDNPYPFPETNPEWIVTKDGVQYVKIPKGRLLVMGDNRNNSNDSRFWPSGPLKRDRVLGKAAFIFWPLNRIRWIR